MKELDDLKGELEAKEDELLAEAEALNDKIQSMTNPDKEYVGGTWVWPAPASHYLTSYFGWRIHPVYGTYKYHSGIDIAARIRHQRSGSQLGNSHTVPVVRRLR